MEINEKLNRILSHLCETKNGLDNFYLSKIFSEGIDADEARYLLKTLINDGVVRHVNINDSDEYISIEYIYETKLFLEKGGYMDRNSVNDDNQNRDKAETLSKNDFISHQRINDLENISVKKFDLSRLITICKEINTVFHSECYIALIMLSRALIDHIPPIFGQADFKNVHGKYGNKSFKENMSHLDNSMRKIADSYLHTHIRKKENLPTITQVNFSQDIDVLLSEIIRKLNEDK